MRFDFWKNSSEDEKIESAPETQSGGNTQELTKEEIPDPDKFWAQRKANIAKARADIPKAKDLSELKNLIATVGEIKGGASSTAVNLTIDLAVESVRWATEIGETEPLLALKNITATDGIRERAQKIILEMMAEEFPVQKESLDDAGTSPKVRAILEDINRTRKELQRKRMELLNLYQNQKSRAVIQAFQPKLAEKIRELENTINLLTEQKNRLSK